MKQFFRNPLYYLLLLTLFSTAASAQDIHFSQFFETPLLRNPALAGIFSGDMRLQAVYRTQWQSVTVPYQTTSVNGEFKLPIGKGYDFITIGGQVLYDKAGTIALTTTQVLPTINYHKSLSDYKNMYLSMGFMGGIVQRSLDRSKVTTNSQFDGNNYNPGLSDGENFAQTSYSYFDGTAGVSFNSQVGDDEKSNMYLGIAYHHFTKPRGISFYEDPNIQLTPKWVYSAGLRLGTSDDSYVTFQGDYSQQGPYTETIAGAMLTKNLDEEETPKYAISGGLYMRWKDAIIPVGKLDMNPLSVSVSYDINTSQLTSASSGRGGLELALTYQKYFENNSSKDAVRCPRF
ncbi:PorP/SprF family type IX secretion system membrane protein [Ferruginibacter albus]|uniref:PorP/SprF family type IX secretion system membrane protein n=1 Tax=Ferruginibacter albus TaxID=2875540 RepID=UPI001CC68937|nr:PorP/SprF family type IX secretion system membrane protein [Ferruginibacter albus]UAY51016.1 PorP/SprF family type IX secretion system membrane protein [Ferruginibacter albus]